MPDVRAPTRAWAGLGYYARDRNLHLTPVADDPEFAVTAGDKWPLQDYLDKVERAAINEALE